MKILGHLYSKMGEETDEMLSEITFLYLYNMTLVGELYV